MNIGIVTTWFARGAAYVSRQYADILAQEHQIYIYARGGEDMADKQGEWSGYNVEYGDRKWDKTKDKKRLNKNIGHFKEWLNEKRIDIAFFNEEHVWTAPLACHEMGIKTGAYIDYYTKHTVPMFGIYDFLVCNTRRHHSVFIWHPQAYYVPWGTDLDRYKPQNYELKDPNKIVFFHSAGMNPRRKGTDLLLKAFDKISRTYPEAKLIIHTQANLVKYFPALEALINKFKDNNKIEIVEKTIGGSGLYGLGDIYVYPTRLEGIGLTIMEALASGLPVIVSDNGPMNEFVDNNNGRLVEIERYYKRYYDHYYWPLGDVNINKLAEAMESFCQNKNLIKTYKIRARKSAEEKMDWNKNSDKILEIFNKARFINDKQETMKKISRHNYIKNNFILNPLNRLRILKLDILPVVWHKIKERL